MFARPVAVAQAAALLAAVLVATVLVIPAGVPAYAATPSTGSRATITAHVLAAPGSAPPTAADSSVSPARGHSSEAPDHGYTSGRTTGGSVLVGVVVMLILAYMLRRGRTARRSLDMFEAETKPPRTAGGGPPATGRRNPHRPPRL